MSNTATVMNVLAENRAKEMRLYYDVTNDSYLLFKGGGKLRVQHIAGKRDCDLYEMVELLARESQGDPVQMDVLLREWFCAGWHRRAGDILLCETVPPATKRVWAEALTFRGSGDHKALTDWS